MDNNGSLNKENNIIFKVLNLFCASEKFKRKESKIQSTYALSLDV